MRVAIVHDWLLGMRGGERVLEVFLELFPEADLFTLFYDQSNISEKISSRRVVASFLNKLPAVKNYYRNLLPLFPLATKELSREIAKNDYDLVISISHCVAKNIKVSQNTFHLCYCLTPMRYIWDKYDDYFKNHRLEPIIRKISAVLRKWDRQAASEVDEFVCISEFIKGRIAAVYKRRARVAYPPVCFDWIAPRVRGQKGEYFLCANALVPYKNTKLVVEAFNELGLPLKVLGRGPEIYALKEMAHENVEFIDFLSDLELAKLYSESRALVFAAEEDFGMIPVEVQAAGRPVICLARGGALETVTNRTGVFFNNLSVVAIVKAVHEFISREDEFDLDDCIAQANKFSKDAFIDVFQDYLIEFDLKEEQKQKALVV